MNETDLLKSRGYKPRKGKVFNCALCSKQIYRLPCHSKGEIKFCTKAHSSEYWRTALKTNSPLNCIICRNEFYCSKSQQRDRNRKTCSMKCRGILTGQRNKGANCIFWRGGVSSENRLIRYSAQMEQWRKEVFTRDDFTCQSCGIRGTYLEAHHIFRFAYFPDLRFNVANGVTLCRPCHDQTKKNDRKLQLIRLDEIQKEEKACAV
jgi:hypothetical protein